MTTSGAGSRLHSSWLVVRRPGGRADDVADELCRTLRDRGVLFFATTLGRLAKCPTYCYAYVAVVLDGPPGDLGAVVDAAEAYRVLRPEGLASARTVEPTQAGVLQVVAPPAVLDALRAGRAGPLVCAVHDIGGWRVEDVLRPLEALGVGARSVIDISTERMNEAWARVRDAWTLPDDITRVPALLEAITRCRWRLEDPRLSAMHRPLAHVPRHAHKNRFDLILDPPDRAEVLSDAAWKALQESGAKVVREYVVPDLRAAFPEVHAPHQQRRGAQKHLKDLVETLELLLTHPDLGGPPES